MKITWITFCDLADGCLNAVGHTPNHQLYGLGCRAGRQRCKPAAGSSPHEEHPPTIRRPPRNRDNVFVRDKPTPFVPVQRHQVDSRGRCAHDQVLTIRAPRRFDASCDSPGWASRDRHKDSGPVVEGVLLARRRKRWIETWLFNELEGASREIVDGHEATLVRQDDSTTVGPENDLPHPAGRQAVSPQDLHSGGERNDLWSRHDQDNISARGHGPTDDITSRQGPAFSFTAHQMSDEPAGPHLAEAGPIGPFTKAHRDSRAGAGADHQQHTR